MIMKLGKYNLQEPCDIGLSIYHLTSNGVEFQTEENVRQNEILQSVSLLCAGLLGSGMVCELQ